MEPTKQPTNIQIVEFDESEKVRIRMKVVKNKSTVSPEKEIYYCTFTRTRKTDKVTIGEYHLIFETAEMINDQYKQQLGEIKITI